MPYFMHAGDTAVVCGTRPIVCIAACTRVAESCPHAGACEGMIDRSQRGGLAWKALEEEGDAVLRRQRRHVPRVGAPSQQHVASGLGQEAAGIQVQDDRVPDAKCLLELQLCRKLRAGSTRHVEEGLIGAQVSRQWWVPGSTWT